MSVKSFNEMPGPRGLPVIGSLLSLSRDQGKVLTSWANEYYGPIFKVNFGSRQVVTLQGYEVIHEALVKKAKHFSGRIDAEILASLNGDKGLFFSDMGNSWKFWHKFAIESLSASWKSSLDGILKEADDFKDHLSQNLGASISLQKPASISMMNTVLQTCFSKRLDIKSDEAEDLYDVIYESASNPNLVKLIFLPALKALPSNKQFVKATEERKKKKFQLLKSMISERRANSKDQTIDIVTYFQQHCQGSDVETDEHLASFISDMIFAGSVTTASQFMWVLLFLLKNPRCQEKVQQELDSVLNGEKLTLDKMKELHYTAAVIEEAYRMRPIAPTASLHKTNTPTSVSGYHIPEDTTVLVNLWSVHMDKSTWFPDPDTFRPERHLSPDGKFVKSGHVIPFSIGFRRCVGERIARTEIVAFLASGLLSYDIKLAEESKDIDFNAVPGTILKPQPFNVVVTARGSSALKIPENLFVVEHSPEVLFGKVMLPKNKNKNDIECKIFLVIVILICILLLITNIALYMFNR